MEPVAYLPTDEDGSTLGYLLCRDCVSEEPMSSYIPIYPWDMDPDDTCDDCLQRIEDTL